MSTSNCPCCSGKPYDLCCGPILTGATKAETAVQLMRARYSAYVTCNIDFLRTSSSPAVQAEFDEEASRRWSQNSQWEGMQVIATEAGEANDETGLVEFIASYKVNGTLFEHHERSSFIRVNGDWCFNDGELVKAQPITREAPKVGRNDPCPCGSGKKFKKCCGK